MDEEMNDRIKAEMDQAQACARDSAPVIATMYVAFRREGLSFIESIFLAAVWMWTSQKAHPADNS